VLGHHRTMEQARGDISRAGPAMAGEQFQGK